MGPIHSVFSGTWDGLRWNIAAMVRHKEKSSSMNHCNGLLTPPIQVMLESGIELLLDVETQFWGGLLQPYKGVSECTFIMSSLKNKKFPADKM